MTDAELLDGFARATLEELHHRDHLRVAWLYLSRDPLEVALFRFSADLRRFAEVKGRPGLYHATVTWAYLFLVGERMAEGAADFDTFAAAHPELLAWRPGILDRYYRPETLASDRARRTFLMPDRHLPASSLARRGEATAAASRR